MKGKCIIEREKMRNEVILFCRYRDRFTHIFELRPTRAVGEAHVESRRVVQILEAHGIVDDA
jgi:hypothetical protein